VSEEEEEEEEEVKEPCSSLPPRSLQSPSDVCQCEVVVSSSL